jgi:hypothetical protein
MKARNASSELDQPKQYIRRRPNKQRIAGMQYSGALQLIVDEFTQSVEESVKIDFHAMQRQ